MRGRWKINRLASASLVALAGMLTAGVAIAQGIPDVPRNRTLISQGWDFYNQVPATDNFNPYAGVLLHQRNSLHYTVNEVLFYTNHNTNTIIPWQGKSWSYNDDFTEVTVKLRDGVKWSDGEPFTAEDVAFTFEMLKAAAPDLVFSSAIKEWVKSVEVIDPLTLKITLSKPGPRWAQDFLATGQATRFVTVPKHIWEGKDPKTFGDFDLAKGWPVGTGPYKLVKSDSSSLVYDLRDDWWAKDVGLVNEMPKVQRIIYIPATEQAMPQLFASNQIDIGRSIQPGTYEAIRAQNPALKTWNDSGPVWGVADGCTFAIRFNTQRPPFDQAAVRRAINFAIDRTQVVNLAYEGSVYPAVVPLSSYQGVAVYKDKLKDLFDKEDIGRHDPQLTAKLLTDAGFKKDANGHWAMPDGSPWQLALQTVQGDPIGPVLVEQLASAGFDVINDARQRTALSEAASTGNFGMTEGTHCGSLYDPWQTLEHFHSKYAPAPGGKATNIRAITGYKNPAYDKIIDQMEAMQPSPDDPKYLGLVRQAFEIYLRDLPEISLAEEMHVLVFNNTYWTGYPSAKDPYVAPFIPWEGFALVIHRLQPTQ
jgi:peptide/nickel transport system substrate-binding protein